MAEYTRTNPVETADADINGTATSTIQAIGRAEHLGRMPAFAGLAKADGGIYAENLGGLTVEDAMTAADLNFTVALIDHNVSVFDDDGGTNVPFPGRGVLATYPDRRKVGMGTVGNTYKPIQNAEMAQIGQAILKEGGANVVAAGAFGAPRGSRTYFAFKLPQPMLIGGQDRHDMYFTLLNSHNGKTGLVGLIAPIRIDCTNMTTATFGKRANRFTMRHSGDTSVKVIDAQEALKMTFKWQEAWKVEAERLLGISCVGADLDDFIAKALQTPASVKTARGADNWDVKRLQIKQIITVAETNEFGRGTAYAAYNGFTEWVDHYQPTKANDPHQDDIARYTRLLAGGTDTDKLKLHAAGLLGIGKH